MENSDKSLLLGSIDCLLAKQCWAVQLTSSDLVLSRRFNAIALTTAVPAWNGHVPLLIA